MIDDFGRGRGVADGGTRHGLARVAVVSMHTSPLAQPGSGDAGGMNVYVLQTARRLAARGVEVEVFTRATSSAQPPVERVTDGLTVRNVVAGPFEGLDKNDLPTQLCTFAAGVLRAEAIHPRGHFDLVHSHYWLSGQVGWLASDRWGVPLVHTAHTLAAVKNANLAVGDTPEPESRRIGEQQIVDLSNRLIANTAREAEEIEYFHGCDPERIDVVPPGVDLDMFTTGGEGATERARRELGIPLDAQVIAFAGRIQPLKAPDVLLAAAAEMVARHPERPLVVLVCGGPSGNGLVRPEALVDLADELGIEDRVRFLRPRPAVELREVFRAADLVAVPSHSESFGLVALEAQACGTPVVAAAVGGLTTAVADGRSGVLVDGHRAGPWADALGSLLDDHDRRHRMAAAAPLHAASFSWEHTVDGLIESYGRALAPTRGRSSGGRSAESRGGMRRQWRTMARAAGR